MANNHNLRPRAPKYKPEYNVQVEKLARSGWIDAQIADFFDVTEKTLNNWKKKYPSFLHAMKKAKLVANAEIESALYHRAKGMKLPDSHVAVIDDKVVITPMEKHIAPETLACIFWLKNREPERWRDTKVLDHGEGVPVKPQPYDEEMQKLGHEALMRYAAKHQQKEIAK